MNVKTVYCEECMEDIPNDEVYWDERRLYCGRCGGEMEVNTESSNVFDAINSKKAKRLLEPEEYDLDIEDEEMDDYEEKDEDEEDFEEKEE